MNQYYALVHHQNGSAFGIVFPDVPGCFAASDEEDGIFEAARDALELYADDMPELPASRSFQSLISDVAVKREIEAGAFLIAVRLDTGLTPGSVQQPDRSATDNGIGKTAASAAAKVLKDPKASKEAKSAAASALTQKGSKENTSKKVATSAAKTLRDPKASKEAKSAAASALKQKKK